MSTYAKKTPNPMKMIVATPIFILCLTFFHQRCHQERRKRWPQSMQFHRRRSLRAPHRSHVTNSAFPHSLQRTLCFGFSAPHFAHLITTPFKDWLLSLFCGIISVTNTLVH